MSVLSVLENFIILIIKHKMDSRAYNLIWFVTDEMNFKLNEFTYVPTLKETEILFQLHYLHSL